MKWRRRPDRDLEEELQAHLAMAKHDRMERGETAEEAEAAARREFGNATLVQETTRAMWGRTVLDQWLQDVQFGLRILRRSPVFTVVAVLSLALGIGANTAIFTWITAVLLRPLDVPNPQALVQVGWNDETGHFAPPSYAQIEQLSGQKEIFSSVAGWLLPIATVEAHAIPSSVGLLVLTRDYFRTFPVRTELGRALQPSDWQGSNAATPVAVISARYWRERFHQDRTVIGKLVTIEGQPFTIVGVISNTFFSPQIEVTPAAAIPVEQSTFLRRKADGTTNPTASVLLCYARLKAGVSLSQAQARLAGLWPRLLRDTQPATLSDSDRNSYFQQHVEIKSAADGQSFLRSRFTVAFRILMTAVGILLLLACVNVASLLLARASARAGEISLRLAVGATRRRLLQQFLVEGSLLSVLATLGGIALSFCFSRMLLPFLWRSPVPLTISLSPDVRILALVAVLTVVVTLLSSFLPGWMTTNENITARMQQTSRAIAGKAGGRLRNALVAGQVALAITLLSGAAFLLYGVHQMRSQELGFNPKLAVTLSVMSKARGYSNIDTTAYSRELLRRVAAQPGVQDAALSSWPPIGIEDQNVQLSTVGAKESYSITASTLTVSRGFFRTMGMPLLGGRDFRLTDTDKSEGVAILSQSAALRLFPHQSALGELVTLDDRGKKKTLRIAGLTGDARIGDFHRLKNSKIYLAMFQYPEASQNPIVEIRVRGDLANAVHAAETEVQHMGREYVFSSASLSEEIEMALSKERMLADLLTFFSITAVALSLIGLYGILSFAVQKKRREFAVRKALGASRHSIFVSVLRNATGLVIAGMLVGIPLAFGATRVLSGQVEGMGSGSILLLPLAAGMLLVSCLLVAVIPAAFAAQIDPARALQDEGR